MNKGPMNARVADATLNVAHRLILEVQEWATEERDRLRATDSVSLEAREEAMNACTRVLLACDRSVNSALEAYHGIPHIELRKRDMERKEVQ